jgi:XTP/dITP diphosphohydrolase
MVSARQPGLLWISLSDGFEYSFQELSASPTRRSPGDEHLNDCNRTAALLAKLSFTAENYPMKVPRLIVLATTNNGKLREVQRALSSLGLPVTDLSEFGEVTPVEEHGKTFAENALMKAQAYATQLGLWTLADDSGLEVDALRGAPGIYSARYAGPTASDLERNIKLLAELSQIENQNRGARFVSAIALVNHAGEFIFGAEGICEGRIARAPRGTNGFGYDPLFIPEGFDSTFGELEDAIKQEISHRARALAQLNSFMVRQLINP